MFRHLRAFSIFFISLVSLLIGIIIWNENYIKNPSDNFKISARNYKELPGLVKSILTAETLIPIDEFKNFKKDNKVKHSTIDKGQFIADLQFYNHEDLPENRNTQLRYTFPETRNLENKLILTKASLRGNLVGKGHLRSRIQIELTDINGKKMFGPRIPFPESYPETYFGLQSATNIPGPFHAAFDPTKIKEISITFIAAKHDPAKFPIRGRLHIEPVQIINDLSGITNLFGTPAQERITKDNFALRYEVNKYRWKNEKNEFFVGINYPWHNYGWDVGKNPYGKPENSGWSSREQKLREDFEYFREIGIEVVRIYAFFDLRAGLEYTNGQLTGFDKYVRPDIQTIIRIAGEAGIKINLVLFDFGIVDGNSEVVGEHPELIFSSQDRSNFLINLMKPILKDMNKWNEMYGNPVYAVELMNEPENIIALVIPGYYGSLVSWLQDLTNIIHNETSFKVTLGSRSIVDMQKWWNELKIDIWQFHFYKHMLYEHDQVPQTSKRKHIKMPGIVFAGEFETYNISQSIQTMKENGYSGLMFWSFNENDGFMLRDTDKLKEIADQIKKLKENTKEAP